MALTTDMTTMMMMNHTHDHGDMDMDHDMGMMQVRTQNYPQGEQRTANIIFKGFWKLTLNLFC